MAEITCEMFTYTVEERDIRAYYVLQAGKPSCKSLVIVHEIWGLNGHVKSLADQFAKQGFAVIVPDLYSSDAFDGFLTGQDKKLMFEFSMKLDRDRLAENSYLNNKISKLPERKRDAIRRIIHKFECGIPRYKLLCVLSKAAYHIADRNLSAGIKVRLINVAPAGPYPALISQEDIKFFYNMRYEENNAQVNFLKEHNPVTPELLGLLRKGEEKLYCIIPFLNLDLNADGINCCCWIYDMEGLNNVPLEAGKDLVKAWKSEAFQRVRESIRDGSYRHCRLDCCPLVRGKRANLLTIEEMRGLYPDIADYIEGRVLQYSGMPIFAHLAVDSVCDLSCPSCNRHLLPNISRQTRSEIIDSIKDVNKNLKAIYIAGMGEPFFSPLYLEWMMNFRKKDFPALEEIEINTNGLKLSPELWEKLPEDLKSLTSMMIISIDGATAATYEKNRKGGSFKTLLKNLAFVKELRNSGRIRHLKAYFTYQANNYREMPGMVELARRFSFDLVSFERLRNWGSYKPGAYRRRDIGNPGHPGYKSLQKIRDEINKTAGHGLKIVFII